MKGYSNGISKPVRRHEKDGRKRRLTTDPAHASPATCDPSRVKYYDSIPSEHLAGRHSRPQPPYPAAAERVDTLHRRKRRIEWTVSTSRMTRDSIHGRLRCYEQTDQRLLTGRKMDPESGRGLCAWTVPMSFHLGAGSEMWLRVREALFVLLLFARSLEHLPVQSV